MIYRKEEFMGVEIFIERLLLAIAFGFLIGLERQFRHKMSAVITNVLVCLGAFLFLTFAYQSGDNEKSRIAGQIISGIGFLGGGVILREGFSIRGLNTAATLWCASGIGMLVSQGYILFAFIGTISIVAANIILKPIATKVENSKYGSQDDEFHYDIEIESISRHRDDIIYDFKDYIKSENIILKGLDVEHTKDFENVYIRISIITFGRNDDVIWKNITDLREKYDIRSFNYKLQNK